MEWEHHAVKMKNKVPLETLLFPVYVGSVNSDCIVYPLHQLIKKHR